MTLAQQIQISIIVPLLNEQDNLPVLYKRILAVLQHLNLEYEIIFVDDGSKDKSFEIIQAMCAENSKVKGISLSRNFGHQVALTAGLEHASGEAIITMDADLQHPPELILELYKKYQSGFDIVNTIREKTENATVFKNITSKYFYKLINKLSDVYIEPASSDFRLMNRKALNAFLKFKERDRFTRGLVSWLGFKQTTVQYMALSRHLGQSKYTTTRMIRFGIDGITSFSSKPLRFSFYFGVIISMIGLAYASYALIKTFSGNAVPGWASILISVLIIGGIQLVTTGIIGEYLARVFNETKNRPLYFVKEYTSGKDFEG